MSLKDMFSRIYANSTHKEFIVEELGFGTWMSGSRNWSRGGHGLNSKTQVWRFFHENIES